MLEILNVTGPIYLLIALGYLSTRQGFFKAADLRVLGQYVLHFALSALVFRALSQRHFSEILNVRFLAMYAAGSLAPLVLGLAVGRWRGQRLAAAAFTGGGMSISNNGFVGSTLLLPLLGPAGAAPFALVLLVESALMQPLLLVLAESEGQDHLPWWRVAGQSLGRVLRLPFVVAIFAGLAVAWVGLSVPAVLDRALELVARSASALSLFVIGGSLVGRRMTGQGWPVAGVMFGKLVLHPLAMLLLVLAWPLADPVLCFAMVAFAAMPMFSVYPILGQRYGLEAFCAAAVAATTVVSFLSISAWLWVLRHGLGWG